MEKSTYKIHRSGKVYYAYSEEDMLKTVDNIACHECKLYSNLNYKDVMNSRCIYSMGIIVECDQFIRCIECLSDNISYVKNEEYASVFCLECGNSLSNISGDITKIIKEWNFNNILTYQSEAEQNNE